MRRFPWPSWYTPPAWTGSNDTRVIGISLIKAACEHSGIEVSDFRSARRCAHNSQARQAVVYVLRRRRPDLSWPQIARIVGRKDHTTVMHANQVAQRKIRKCETFQALVAGLEMVQ